jgi:hypothetical protein
MYGLIPFFLALIICLALFLVPHHRRQPESFKSCTLAEIYGDMLEEMPRFLKPSALVLLLLGLAGIFACFYPALMILMIRYLSLLSTDIRLLFALCGLICLVGAMANLLAMLLSHVNFAFGGGSSTKDQTFFIYLIPIFQTIIAVISILLSCSTTFAQYAARFTTM